MNQRNYEKTKKGFLMRLYHNMKCRVNGVQTNRAKYFKGVELLGKEEFYDWANKHLLFHKLFYDWEISGYERRLVPSIDRIDSSKGYVVAK